MTSFGAILFRNGQEFGQDNWIPNDNESIRKTDRRVKSRPLEWSYLNDEIGISLFNLYKELIKIRNNFSIFRDFGKLKFYDLYKNDNISYSIKTSSHIAFILLNFSNKDDNVKITLPEKGEWEDVLNSHIYDQKNEDLTITIKSNYGCILIKK